MMGRLLPATIDNAPTGHPLAPWVLAPVVAVKAVMGVNLAGLNPFVSPARVLESVDGVPLTSMPAETAATIIASTSAWALALLVLSALAILALVRYRAMAPLMALALLAEQAGRMALTWEGPVTIERLLTAAMAINGTLAVALAVSLVLWLVPRRPDS